jgi:hypothetical protein
MVKKSSYRNVMLQNRMQRVIARLLLSIAATCAAVLLKSTLVHAAVTAQVADIGGTWEMAGIAAPNDSFTVKLNPRPDRVVLTLPEPQMHLASGRDVTLAPCDTRAYCSAKDFSPTVRFELTAKNRASLSIKGAGANGLAYLDVPLQRQRAD